MSTLCLLYTSLHIQKVSLYNFGVPKNVGPHKLQYIKCMLCIVVLQNMKYNQSPTNTFVNKTLFIPFTYHLDKTFQNQSSTFKQTKLNKIILMTISTCSHQIICSYKYFYPILTLSLIHIQMCIRDRHKLQYIKCMLCTVV